MKKIVSLILALSRVLAMVGAFAEENAAFELNVCVASAPETIDPNLTSVIESSPDDNNYKDQDEFSRSGYGERTLEEETAGDFEGMFGMMPTEELEESDY